METIELKLSLTGDQFKAIYYGLKALTDIMSAILADNMADKLADNVADTPSSNTYIDTNTSKESNTCKDSNTNTDTNTYRDYKTRVETLITSLASNTNMNTSNTTKSTLNTTLTTPINKNNNNININNMSSKEIDNMSGKENTNTSIENSNTCKEEDDIPTLQDVIRYVNYRGYQMNSQKFFDYYKNNGWKTMGGVSIAGKWRGFVDKWAQNEYKAKGQPQASTPKGGQAGMGTVEDRHAAHPFVPSFNV